MTKYWIGVVSREHVHWGVEGGYMQLNHGKQAPLRKMSAGDWMAYYSPRTSYPDGEQLQCFTAIGKIRTGEVYQADMGGDFKPYRLDIDYYPCEEAPIQPLIPILSFIKDKTHWGAGFRFGFLEVSQEDFSRIAAAMGVDLDKTEG